MFSIFFLQCAAFPQDLTKTDLLSSLAQPGEYFLWTKEKKLLKIYYCRLHWMALATGSMVLNFLSRLPIHI